MILWAKARNNLIINNPGLKPGVSKSYQKPGFSPKLSSTMTSHVTCHSERLGHRSFSEGDQRGTEFRPAERAHRR